MTSIETFDSIPIRGDLNGHQVNAAVCELTNENYGFGFELGSFSDGHFPVGSANRIRSFFLPVNKGDYFSTSDNTVNLAVHLFNPDGSFNQVVGNSWTTGIAVPEDGFVYILMKYANDASISESAISDIAAKLTWYQSGAGLTNRLSFNMQQQSLLGDIQWGNRVFNFDNGNINTRTNLLGMSKIVTALTDLIVSVDSGYVYGLGVFSGTTLQLQDLITHTVTWQAGETFIKAGTNFLVNFKKADDSNIQSPAEETTKHIKFDPFGGIRAGSSVSDYPIEVTWQKGSLNAIGIVSDGNYAVSPILYNVSRFYVRKQTVILLYNDSKYLGKINTGGTLDKIAGNWKWFGPGIINVSDLLVKYNATGIRLAVQPVGTITAENAQEVGDNSCSFYKSYYTFYGIDSGNNDYSVGTSFVKAPLKTTLLGTLTYLQSFCKYDGKYYSVDGSSIAVQDESFNVLQNVTLGTGHGNSLQLGHGGIAYASGWNDNKVYVVNLETLTVDSVINLPTTGYTTAAIDDINEVAYIFQRDSYPDTETNYNFIVYDYANNEVISTRKTKAFGAMQGCDYYEGKIIVAYGLGSTTVPSGMFVCNTIGDILEEFFIEAIATTEPEGVCYDRDSNELLFSTVARELYKVERV